MTAPGLFALCKKPRLFHGSAHHPLSRTWDELAGNKELHKGVEFGVKAAGEVSKDVWEQAGKDALSAGGSQWLKTKSPKEPALSDLLPPAGGLAYKGFQLYKTAPERARNLGDRLESIRRDVYTKE